MAYQNEVKPVHIKIRNVDFEMLPNYDPHNGHFVEFKIADTASLTPHTKLVAAPVMRALKEELEKRFGVAEDLPRDPDIDTVQRTDGVFATRGHWRDKDEENGTSLKAVVYNNGFIQNIEDDIYAKMKDALSAAAQQVEHGQELPVRRGGASFTR